jgi:hypothetical protein
MVRMGPTKNQVSYINQCEMLTTPKCLDPIEKCERKPLLIVVKSILLKASIIIPKRGFLVSNHRRY